MGGERRREATKGKVRRVKDRTGNRRGKREYEKGGGGEARESQGRE